VILLASVPEREKEKRGVWAGLRVARPHTPKKGIFPPPAPWSAVAPGYNERQELVSQTSSCEHQSQFTRVHRKITCYSEHPIVKISERSPES